MQTLANLSRPCLWSLLLLCVTLPLYPRPVVAQALPCPHQGDVNNNGHVSPADALLAFQYFLGLVQLTACAQDQANVVAPATSIITPADALCIFQAFLGLPSCFDRLRLSAEPCNCTGSASDKVDLSVRVTREGGGTTLRRALTNAGTGVPNVPVTFRRTAGDGMFVGSTATTVTVITDANGRATATLQLGTALIQIVEARAQGIPETVSFEIVGFVLPRALAVEADKSLVVADAGLNALLRVDPITGARTLLSGHDRGSGPDFINPFEVTVGANGTLVVLDGFAETLNADLLCFPQFPPRVLQVDPKTGDRTIISNVTHGCGQRLLDPRGIAIELSDTLVVVQTPVGVIAIDPPNVPSVDLFPCGVIGPVERLNCLDKSFSNSEAVLRVDPKTGDRTIVSDDTHGSGPNLTFPIAITVESSHTLVVADAGLQAVLRVDPVTGDRTIVSGCAKRTSSLCTGEFRGTGLDFADPVAVAVAPSGTLVVRDSTLKSLLQVDPVTGDRTVINTEPLSSSVSSGGIAIEANGSVVVIDVDQQAVIRVNPSTGSSAIVSRASPIGKGPAFLGITAITVERNGSLIVSSAGAGLVRVDPLTGDRTVIAGDIFSSDGITVIAKDTLAVVNTTRPQVRQIDLLKGTYTVLSGCTDVDSTGCVGRIVGSGPSLASPAGITVETNGTLVVADRAGMVVRIDPGTGDRTIVSDAPHDSFKTQSIAVEPSGNLLVAMRGSAPPLFGIGVPFNSAVGRVDPGTGDRTIVSDRTHGSGPSLPSLAAIAVESSHTLVVADDFLNAVFQVDLFTGNRTLVSGCANGAIGEPRLLRPQSTFVCTGEFKGSGVRFVGLNAIAVEPGGTLVVTDSFLDAVLRVDPVTGDRTILSRGIR